MPEVLIVGGGLAGLTAALFLNRHGVDAVLVERRAETSSLPKARRINVRTVELFRQLGIADRVREAAGAPAFGGGQQAAAAGPSLLAAEPLELPRPPAADAAAVTIAETLLCAQDVLEPVLRRVLAERGGAARFGVECVRWAEVPGGIVATLREPDGTVGTLEAEYLIAADGAHSAIRDGLGIARGGRGAMEPLVNIEFDADLAEHVRGRENTIFQITNDRVRGGLVAAAGGRRWFFTSTGGPARSPDEWVEAMRAAVGLPDAPLRINRVLEWTPGMFVADRFRSGRAFLVGDAAHVMPPYAALGANTGIQAAHNLAWKLAAVLRGAAAPELLDTYHDERHPVGWFTAEQSSLRSAADLRRMYGQSADGTPLADPTVLIMGAQYRSAAVVPDGTTARTDRFEPSGQPGTRLPHRALGPDRSTLDLIGTEFALLTGPDRDRWRAAATLPAPAPVPHRMDAAWARTVGLADDGALLVRPDQVVAWRSVTAPAQPAEALAVVLGRVLARTPRPAEPAGGGER